MYFYEYLGGQYSGKGGGGWGGGGGSGLSGFRAGRGCLRSAECGVWNAECGRLMSAERGGSAECGRPVSAEPADVGGVRALRAECGLQTAGPADVCGARSTAECGVRSFVLIRPCCLIRKWFRVFSEMVFWEIQNGFFGNVFLGKHMFFIRKRCFLRNTLQTRKFKLILILNRQAEFYLGRKGWEWLRFSSRPTRSAAALRRDGMRSAERSKG